MQTPADPPIPDWIPPSLMPLAEWLVTPWVLVTMTLLSAGMVVASLVGVSWAARRIPQDYLFENAPRPPARGTTWVGRVLRNVVGVVVLLLGVLMVPLPGQGLLTIFLALTLIDFPGKRALERRIVAAPAVLQAINALRRRAGQPELRLPRDDD